MKKDLSGKHESSPQDESVRLADRKFNLFSGTRGFQLSSDILLNE
jgi:hypothetical protein